MDLSIIIVNWNSVEHLRKCLRSLSTCAPDLHFEVLVIDSGSFDGCAEMIASAFPQVHFIQSEKNIGFATANNRAARRARGEVLLFLNPDTEMQGDSLRTLYRALKSLPGAGAVGPRLLNSDGTIQTSCIQSFPTALNQLLDSDVLRKWFPRSFLWGMAPLFSSERISAPVEGISGACLMTHREAYDAVGGLSESYFMYYEDMDYCLKLRKAGWDSYYVPEAKVVHHGGKSSGGEHSRFASVMKAESAWRFFQREKGWVYAVLFRFCMGANAAARSCIVAPLCAIAWKCQSRRRVKGLFRKWAAILSWSIGGERWTADYQ